MSFPAAVNINEMQMKSHHHLTSEPPLCSSYDSPINMHRSHGRWETFIGALAFQHPIGSWTLLIFAIVEKKISYRLRVDIQRERGLVVFHGKVKSGTKSVQYFLIQLNPQWYYFLCT